MLAFLPLGDPPTARFASAGIGVSAQELCKWFDRGGVSLQWLHCMCMCGRVEQDCGRGLLQPQCPTQYKARGRRCPRHACSCDGVPLFDVCVLTIVRRHVRSGAVVHLKVTSISVDCRPLVAGFLCGWETHRASSRVRFASRSYSLVSFTHDRVMSRAPPAHSTQAFAKPELRPLSPPHALSTDDEPA